uniref:Cholinergic receptor nicotinic alpha 3 subunit n=1 Tax=Scleropages formosus TaxID=113540 RepID=A0A8C9QYV5_SCLFO
MKSRSGSGPLPALCTCILKAPFPFSDTMGSEMEHRLFSGIFSQYNPYIRPVENLSDPVIVQFEVSMSQLVKVDEVNQIMETNLWLRHVWNDYKLRWDPREFGGVEFIRVPSRRIWKPDIVLYNNGEWMIIDAPGYKHDIKYNCCEEIYTDITYSLYIRRLPLFYTINMIIPCLLISFLTVLVFYLPSDCGEKVTLCISVLLSLTVFLLVITETIPSTSLVIPLIGEYLLFTMVFVTLSIVITVFVLNVHYRTPKTHSMPAWVRLVFLGLLPRVMFMTRPARNAKRLVASARLLSAKGDHLKYFNWLNPSPRCHTLSEQLLVDGQLSNLDQPVDASMDSVTVLCHKGRCSCCWHQALSKLPTHAGQLDCGRPSLVSPAVRDAIESVHYIAKNMRVQNKTKEVYDWKYVAMVVDRIFLWVFILACVLGTAGLFFQPLLLGDTF